MTPESAELPESVDLMIEARWVLPIAPVNTVLADHAVAVSSGRIVALGPISQMNARFEARERVVRRDHALLPGFVNAHTRAATTLLRGLPVAGPRGRWLRDTVGPVEQRCMSPDFVREGTQLAIAEMLRAGITAFADMYWFPEEAARAASAARMRAAIGLPVTDAPNQWAENANAHFEKAEQLWDEYKSDPWVCLYFAPHDAACLSETTFIRLRRIADELDARVAVEEAPLRKLNDIGLLRPGFTAIGNVSDADFELVASTGVCVVACVQADLRLGGRVMPLSRLDSQAVTVGLGTGAPASVGALDMLSESRAAALHGLLAEDVLRMATLGGATALGIGSLTGSIEPGKSADLVCFDLNRLACQPARRVSDTLVFGATREQASDVWTSGRAVVSGSQLLAFDEPEMARLQRKWSIRVQGDPA
jgi:5-methylthioadenosine/S-adenosylhomocysteine deaminase